MISEYKFKPEALVVVSQDGKMLEYISKELRHDKEIVLAAVKQDGYALEYASEELHNDKDIVLAAVSQDGYALQYASKELKKSRDVVLTAITQNGNALRYVNKELWSDKQVISAALQGGLTLHVNEQTPQELCNSKPYMLAAVKQSWKALQYASQELQKDRDVILQAVSQNGEVLLYTDKNFCSDEEIVNLAIENGLTLSVDWKTPQGLCDSKPYMLAAVSQNGNALKYANKKLRESRDIILASVNQNGNAILYANREFWSDEEIVSLAIKRGLTLHVDKVTPQEFCNSKPYMLAAVSQNGNALKYANKKLRESRDIILAAVNQDGNSILYANREFWSDEEIVSSAIKRGLALNIDNNTPMELRNSKPYTLAVIKQNWNILKYISQELQMDKDIIFAAIEQNGNALLYANQEFCNDGEIVNLAIENGLTLDVNEQTPQKLCNNKPYMLAAVRRNGNALLYANQEFCNDGEIVNLAIENGLTLDVNEQTPQELCNSKPYMLAAVRQNVKALLYASQELQKNYSMILQFIRQNGNALLYASKEFWSHEEAVNLAIENGLTLHVNEQTPQELCNNKSYMMAAAKQNGNVLKYASQELQIDKELVLIAIKQNGKALQYASRDLQKDREVVMKSIKQNGKALQYAGNALQDNYDIVIKSVEQNGNALLYADKKFWGDDRIINLAIKNGLTLKIDSNTPQELCNSKPYMLATVSQKGNALLYANKELWNDEEIVKLAIKNGLTLHVNEQTPQKRCNSKPYILAAVSQNGNALLYANKEFWSDEKIVNLAIENGLTLDVNEQTPQELCNSKPYMLAAVRRSGKALLYASQELQKNHSMILQFIQQNGNALLYANREFWRDEELVNLAIENGLTLDVSEQTPQELCNSKPYLLSALKQNGSTLKYASQELQRDREIVFTAIKQNGNALLYASKEFWSDEELVNLAIENGLTLHINEQTPQELCNNKSYMMAAAKQNGNVLKYASQELQIDKELVLIAIKQNGKAIQYISRDFQIDYNMVIHFIKQNGNALLYVDKIFWNDDEIIHIAVKNGLTLDVNEQTPHELCNNKSYMMAATKQNGNALKYASKDLQKDYDIVINSVGQNGNALLYADKEFWSDDRIINLAIKKGLTLKVDNNTPYELCNSKPYMLAVVKQDSYTWKYVSKALQNDNDIARIVNYAIYCDENNNRESIISDHPISYSCAACGCSAEYCRCGN